MKTLRFLLPMIAVVMLASCGAQNDKKDATADSTAVVKRIEIPNPVTEVKYYDTDSTELGISARIENGKVYVTTIYDKVMGLRMGEFRLPDATNEVKNLEYPVVSLFIGDIGQDYNPVLCMIREDGKLQILDIFSAVFFTGDMFASYPLDGFDDIIECKPANFEDYRGILAVDVNGEEKEVPYNPLPQKVLSYDDHEGENHTIMLTGDWKIYYRITELDKNGIVDEMDEYVGEYTSGFEGGEMDKLVISYKFHTKADIMKDNATPKADNSIGSFQMNFGPAGSVARTAEIMMKKGEGIELPRGKKVQFQLVER